MENLMRSIIQYVLDNRVDFGLDANLEIAEQQVQPVKNSGEQLKPGDKRLIITDLRTLPDQRTAPFGNLTATAQEMGRFETQIEIEMKMRTAAPDQVFYWNLVRRWRDLVYKTLAGPTWTGLKITRYDWIDEENPVADGEIWFIIAEERGTPIEDSIEDPDDPGVKSIIQTWTVRWTRAI